MTSNRAVIESIEGEYRRYKHLAEETFRQLSEEQLASPLSGGDNSVTTIAWHVAGNLRSRFTDFLTTDGEKPWRDRDSEFLPRHVNHAELLAFWGEGWRALFGALAELDDAMLERKVQIRGASLPVIEALHRSLAHTSYHAGQIVFIGKNMRGSDWSYLSIPPGQSKSYTQSPTLERPPG